MLFAAVVALFALLCYREYARLAAGHGLAIPQPVGYALGLLLLFAGPRELAVAGLGAILGLGFALRSDDLRQSLPNAGAFVLGLVYVFGAWRAGIALHAMNPHWFFFAVALNWTGDVAAYYVGRAVGKRKLAPRVSPGKSWEGAIASALASIAFGMLYLGRFVPDLPMWQLVTVAAVGNAAGQLGDLAESALKRGAGVKDSGTMLPGHGGWLDRLDSSLFAMPAVYAFLVFVR